MKKLILPIGVLLAGLGAGGGAAVATRAVLHPKQPSAADEALVFIPVAKIVAPLILRDGTLAGYVSFDAELQVPEASEPDITVRLPLLLHALNMRTYRLPLAAGPDGMLPNIGELRTVMQAACAETFGKSAVRRIAITRAEPI